VSDIVLDTTQATDTVDYVATDLAGNTFTPRTVIIDAATTGTTAPTVLTPCAVVPH
jgi:hypothetical protein